MATNVIDFKIGFTKTKSSQQVHQIGRLQQINVQHAKTHCHIITHSNLKPNLRQRNSCSVLTIIRGSALTLSQWSSSGNPVAIQCAWNLDPSVHWNATGEMPVCFQWLSSGLPVCSNYQSGT